jgi:5-formyltetrahydrofolate cyclo-ligase
LTLVLDKARLRKECRKKRRAHFRAIGPQGLRRAAEALRDYALGADSPLAQLDTSLPTDRPKIIAGYWPRLSEIDPRLIMAKLAEHGHDLALPVVVGEGQPLVFRRWAPGVDLETGFFEIPVPCDSAEIVEPDVALVPMIGFDRHCNRLGQGGGYYDRTFARRRPALVIGIAFGLQEVMDLPHGPGDAVMDAIITDQGVIRAQAE